MAKKAGASSEEIIAALDVRAEYAELGLRIVGSKPNGKGWIEAHAHDREDSTPSAGINVLTGRYKDQGGGLNLSLWDFAALVGRFSSPLEGKDYYAVKAGFETADAKPKPDANLKFREWNDTSVQLWTRHKPGITPEAIQAAGGRIAMYRDKYKVIALPILGPADSKPIGWVLWNTTGYFLPKYTRGKAEPDWVKMLTTYGSEAGIMVCGCDHRNLAACEQVWSVEGPGDMLAGWASLPVDLRGKHGFTTNSNGAGEHPLVEILKLYEGANVALVRDCDKAGELGAEKWLPAIAREAKTVRRVRLPYEIVSKKGKDLRDYLNDGNSYEDLLDLVEAVEPTAPTVGVLECDEDPHRLARLHLNRTSIDGQQRVWYWREEWHLWEGYAYRRMNSQTMQAKLTAAVKEEFDRLNLLEQQAAKAGALPNAKPVDRRLVGNVLNALTGYCILPGDQEPPFWIDPSAASWPAEEVMSTASGLLHLPTLVDHDAEFLAGEHVADYLLPPSPNFFTPNAVNYAFNLKAPPPSAWLSFLDSILPDDDESKSLIQQWFGYCLTPDTSHHKMLMVLGPMRCGKGTLARILCALIGHGNAIWPKLGSLQNQFGLMPFIGKSLAVFGDARITGRMDTAAIIENLLSITGGDGQTIDRKHLPSLTEARLKTRLMLLSNEMPNLRDDSGAFATRCLIVRLIESFLDREDKHLEEKLLKELPSILAWAIVGWSQLREQGCFTKPEATREIVEEFANYTSPIRVFVDERLSVGKGLEAPASDLFKEWAKHCDEHGMKSPGNSGSFSKQLRALLPKIKSYRKRDASGKQEWWYGGIAIKSDFYT